MVVRVSLSLLVILPFLVADSRFSVAPILVRLSGNVSV